MNLQIVFADSPSDSKSEKYIESQPDWQQPILRAFVDELIKNRKIDHPDARKLDNDHWSLWVRREGEDAVNHVCYLARTDEPILSAFARELMNLDPKQKQVRKQPSKSLLVLQSDRHAVAIGKADKYLSPQYYAMLMDSVCGEVFLKTIEDIRNGRLSTDYTINADGSISLHINKPELAYGVHINCILEWVNTADT